MAPHNVFAKFGQGVFAADSVPCTVVGFLAFAKSDKVDILIHFFFMASRVMGIPQAWAHL